MKSCQQVPFKESLLKYENKPIEENPTENILRRSSRNSRRQRLSNKKPKGYDQSESVEENSLNESHNGERNEDKDLQPNPYK